MPRRKDPLDVIREGIAQAEDDLRKLRAAEAALTNGTGKRRRRRPVGRPRVRA